VDWTTIFADKTKLIYAHALKLLQTILKNHKLKVLEKKFSYIKIKYEYVWRAKAAYNTLFLDYNTIACNLILSLNIMLSFQI